MLPPMARPRREQPSPSALAPALLRYARQRGADATLLASRVGIAPDVFTHDQVSITVSALGDLLDATAEALGEPYLALAIK
jgi:hypothetical protein